MQTSKSLIDRLGGVQSVAESLSYKWKSVHNWTRPGRSIPARVWPQLVRLGQLQEVDVTFEMLEHLQINPSERVHGGAS